MGLDVADLNAKNVGVLSDFAETAVGDPDDVVAEFFEITKPQWVVLNESLRSNLKSIANSMKDTSQRL